MLTWRAPHGLVQYGGSDSHPWQQSILKVHQLRIRPYLVSRNTSAPCERCDSIHVDKAVIPIPGPSPPQSRRPPSLSFYLSLAQVEDWHSSRTPSRVRRLFRDFSVVCSFVDVVRAGIRGKLVVRLPRCAGHHQEQVVA